MNADTPEIAYASSGRPSSERDGACICDYNPDTTDGPQEDCPFHGRPYAYWVERVDALSARLADPAYKDVEVCACSTPGWTHHTGFHMFVQDREQRAVKAALSETLRRLREVFGTRCSDPCPHVGCQAQHIVADVRQQDIRSALDGAFDRPSAGDDWAYLDDDLSTRPGTPVGDEA